MPNKAELKAAPGYKKLQDTKPGEIPDKGAITTPGDESRVGPSSGTDTESLANLGGGDFAIEGTAPGGEDDPQVKMGDMDGGAGAGGAMAELKATLAEISQGLKLLLQKAGVTSEPQMAPPEAPSNDLAPVSGMRANRPSGAGAGFNVEKAVLRAVGPLMAELTTLKKKQNDRERDERITLSVQNALQDLQGYDIDEKTVDYFRRCASYGGEFFQNAVENFKRNTLPEPPTDAEEFEAELMSGPEADTLNTFASRHPGPRAAEWVRAQAKSHAAWSKLTNSAMPLDAWLETNWRHEQEGTIQTG